MSNTIVSIRIPESMARELRERLKYGHYLDMSEAVRGIVRKKWLEFKDPSAYQVKQLREDIKGVLEEKTKKSKEEIVLQELQKLRELLSEGELKK